MIWKRIGIWFLVNAILPMLVPAFFLAVIQWLKDGSFPFFSLIVDLIKEGFYVFSALTLIFSLYEDYGLLKKCVSPLLQTWVVCTAIATSIMFYLMRQGTTTDYMENNLFQFFVIWIVTVTLAVIIKYRILKKRSML